MPASIASKLAGLVSLAPAGRRCMDYRIGNSWLNSLLDDKAVLGQGQSGASS
tara:strand:+ start:985 stop:1140 length:156 start_codon:yes stop_codon:yes gene_type:complete